MIYRNTINIERISLSPLDNINSTQFVELVKFGDVATFGVLANECFWEFDMSEPSDYERVKMNIYDAIFECDTMDELCEALNAIFEDGFATILVSDENDCEEDDEFYDEEDDAEEWEDDKDVDDDDNDSPYCGCLNCRKYRH